MKKILTVTLLIIAGIIGGIFLIAGAVLELVEGILSMIFWTIVILVGYFFVKSKVK